MKLISIVFSFKNEETNIKELVERVNNTLTKLENCKYELIFVNDSSTDGSELLLEELQKNYPITTSNKDAKVVALKSGKRTLYESRFQYFTKKDAQLACSRLKKYKRDCFIRG